MKKPISIAFAPNLQKDDVKLSLKLLAQRGGQSTKELEKHLGEFLPAKHVFAFSSGRTAFYHLLLSLGLAPGDEVLIQALTCVAVPNSILWAKLKPVYVDIEKKTFNMNVDDLKRRITKKSRVIVVQHTFGTPALIEPILAIARKHNLIVIEDCAHSLGALYDNKNIGTFGETSFYSFGRSKVISSVFGGAVSTNNDLLAKKLKKQQEGLKRNPYFFVLQQLLYPIIYSISLPVYQIGLGRLFLKISSLIGLLSKEVYKKEQKGGRPPFASCVLDPRLSSLALHQLKKIKKYVSHRKNIAKIYERGLGKTDLKAKNTLPAYLRFSFLVSNRKKLLKEAKKNNIYLGNWYPSPVFPSSGNFSAFNYTPGICPTAEFVSRHIINLPTHINISVSDAEYIVKFLQKGQKEKKWKII